VASSDPAPTAPGLSCADGSRAGRRTPGGSQQSGAEGQRPLPYPTGHPAGDAAQAMAGLLGCKHTLPGHVELLINQHPQVLLCRAALCPVFVLGISPTHVQDIALDLVELHEVHMGPICF